MYDYELYHHGVKGMKWGVRKDANKDSTRRNYKTGDKLKKTLGRQVTGLAAAGVADWGMRTIALATKDVVGLGLVYTNPTLALGYKVASDLLAAGTSAVWLAEVGRATIDIGADAVSTFMHNRRVSKNA